ncbi:hypothetical protein HNR01_001747 [Methylorubrum rhodesianum]|uniref:hypothetical protein n=1 Tax=Methylorubrum rhodesianum TaxID=29427 RepID=UPI001609A5DE|nr:hypothetical protein [Methylorubrum rhodesianum]MBB5762127.1 hypothetical protein [Methylorubrum rhodesianum]
MDLASLWFASLAALFAQRAAVVGGFEREEHGIVIAIPGSLLAVGFALLLVGR